MDTLREGVSALHCPGPCAVGRWTVGRGGGVVAVRDGRQWVVHPRSPKAGEDFRHHDGGSLVAPQDESTVIAGVQLRAGEVPRRGDRGYRCSPPFEPGPPP